MGKNNNELDPYEIAKRAQVIKNVFDPSAPLVKLETIIVVSVSKGDGSSEHPGSHTSFYYKKDGTLIGEEE